MRLIDADKLKYKHQVSYSDTTRPYTLNCISFDEIQKAPTIQAVPIEVLDKIRAKIEAEMNDLYRQKSIDQRTLTIIHACQRHIAIIDEYTKGEGE